MKCARLLLSGLRPAHHRTMTAKVSFKGLFKENPIPVPPKLEVNLTPKENQLCTLLDECKQDLASKGQSVECRISGGWVRDKVCQLSVVL